MSDAELFRDLMARVRGGDERAAEELVKRYEATVRLAVRGRAGVGRPPRPGPLVGRNRRGSRRPPGRLALPADAGAGSGRGPVAPRRLNVSLLRKWLLGRGAKSCSLVRAPVACGPLLR